MLITNIESLMGYRYGWRAGKKTVVFTNGCFDLLHAGHVKLLEQAKAHGDKLIVAVNSDAMVRELKGEGRPIIPLEDRMTMVDALKAVDYVLTQFDQTPLQLVLKLEPDVLVKGTEYLADEIVGANVLKRWGGILYRVPMFPEHSTTQTIRRIITGGKYDYKSNI